MVGQDEATARNLIEQAGFTVATREEESADEAPGTVIRQTPAAKETSRLGSTGDHHRRDGTARAETPTPTPHADRRRRCRRTPSTPPPA